ncbi:LytR/AlgR family response regulator transcription factor [Mucilaginibacter gotjawali]|uniref:Sensory transduction protein LytR n=2 Tax=Mucilaginibacter gotjawali TaxID=1550579 RepID=A0A0X8X402_9SPHI|nr:LytTR family DNA-binding domain-containing protein [Mucilaginibacter gotjawali]MBB3055871.1 DNA-binding LytR/AlgR family response regulator [Mucilaginibacter gotjawali]BAU54693.1 Sensory transduction protein LytR [Mucilaginibacter gotjawali]
MSSLRVVIIEDEPVSARNLAHLLNKLDDSIAIKTILGSVEESVKWFNNAENNFDLVFMDIRLADGLSFDIFKLANVSKPVIFVTAYNDYAIQAFKNNGIDYILKPFDDEEVEQALRKFNNLTSMPVKSGGNLNYEQLINQLNENARPYKKSFLVHFRDKLIPLETEKIAWFYTANELVYAHTIDSRQYIVDFTMEQLEQQLDMNRFFRANRQFIVNRKEITEVAFYFNGRLVVKIKPEPPENIIISKARSPEFKSWMNK